MALATAWERIAAALEAFLAEAQRAGALSAEVDCGRVAGLLLSGWEGALIAMRAQRNTQPLREFLDLLFEPLLGNLRSP